MATLTIDQAKLLSRQRFVIVVNELLVDVKVATVARTPILTGTARAGWSVQEIANVGDTGSVDNDVSYILKLEYGSSQQAPAGMARITAAESQQRADAICARYR